MFDTRERCVECLMDFTVYWGDVEKNTGKREYYGTSRPAVLTSDGWRCAECIEKRRGLT